SLCCFGKCSVGGLSLFTSTDSKEACCSDILIKRRKLPHPDCEISHSYSRSRLNWSTYSVRESDEVHQRS
ncbi:hypothetical protein PENTCL1PPCAC_13382, partial [Pristionchus entomophagus]